MSNEENKGLGITLDTFEAGAKDEFAEFAKLKTKRKEKTDTVEDDETEKFTNSKKEGTERDSGPPEVTVVPRSEWSRIELPERRFQFKEAVEYVMLTHTGTGSCSKTEDCIRILRNIQRNHIALGFADIVYNFMVGGDGKVYEGRGWQWESAWIPKVLDTEGKTTMKIAHIGYYGDYSKKKVEPKQVKLIMDFIETGMYKNYVKWNATMIPDCNEPDNVDII